MSESLRSGGESLAALKAMVHNLNQVSDFDVMMETILTEARRFVGAEAGSIYVRDGDRLVFTYAQNDSFGPEENRKLANYKDQEIPITDNSMVSYTAREGTILNVADAYAIGVDKPYRFNQDFDRKTGYITRSCISIPLKDIRFNVIGILQVINRKGEDSRVIAFDQGDEELLLIFSTIAALALERTRLIRQMLIRAIKMAELRDPGETVRHAQRVGLLSAMIYEQWARRRNLEPCLIKRTAENLRMAAMVHDIGKVGVSDTVLNKPGRLTAEERGEVQRHVLVGLKIFEPIDSELDEMIADVILNHHERWDGRGYPGWVDPKTGLALPGRRGPDGQALGKKGDEISIYGRIAAVADVFDALSSTRCYKDAFDRDLACQIMMQESGHHFDPELVDILLENFEAAQRIRQSFPE